MYFQQPGTNYYVLAISAGKAGGATEQLLLEALNATRSAGSVNTELIRLCDTDIHPCRGCNSCKRQPPKGGADAFCVNQDDFTEIFEKIKFADAILFGTPEDSCFPPAAAIRLLDRGFGISRTYTDQCWSHRKYGAVIAVSGTRPTGYLIPISVYLLHRFHKGITVADTVNIQLESPDSDIPQECRKRAFRTGKKIASALLRNEIYLEPPIIYYGDPSISYQLSPCPGCGNGIIRFTDENHFACGVCNSMGAFIIKDGRVFIQWDPESVKVNMLSYGGELVHRKNMDGNTNLKAPVRPEEEVRSALTSLMKEGLTVTPGDLPHPEPTGKSRRILGISAGRILGNTETVLRAALLEAEKVSPDIRTEMICLRDLKLSDPLCSEESTSKDDFQWIMEQMKNADAIILGAPAYCLLGPAEMMCLLQKCARLNENSTDTAYKKSPVAAIFSVAGGPRHTYLWDAESLLLRSVHPGIHLIERQEFLYISEKAQIVFDEEKMARAREMGRHVADALFDDVPVLLEYQFGRKGGCPRCGSMNIELHQDGSLCCPVCGTFGSISADSGKPELIWSISD